MTLNVARLLISLSSEWQFSRPKCLVHARGPKRMARLLWAKKKAITTQMTTCLSAPTWKHGFTLPCINTSRQFSAGGVILCKNFLAHFESLSANWALFKCQTWIWLPTSSSTVHRVPIFWWLLPNHLKLVSQIWKQDLVTSTVTNRALLGCETGASHHGCGADKCAACVWRYHVNMKQNLRGVF